MCPRSGLRVSIDVVSGIFEDLQKTFPIVPALDPVEGQKQSEDLLIGFRKVRIVSFGHVCLRRCVSTGPAPKCREVATLTRSARLFPLRVLYSPAPRQREGQARNIWQNVALGIASPVT